MTVHAFQCNYKRMRWSMCVNCVPVWTGQVDVPLLGHVQRSGVPASNMLVHPLRLDKPQLRKSPVRHNAFKHKATIRVALTLSLWHI